MNPSCSIQLSPVPPPGDSVFDTPRRSFFPTKADLIASTSNHFAGLALYEPQGPHHSPELEYSPRFLRDGKSVGLLRSSQYHLKLESPENDEWALPSTPALSSEPLSSDRIGLPYSSAS